MNQTLTSNLYKKLTPKQNENLDNPFTENYLNNINENENGEFGDQEIEESYLRFFNKEFLSDCLIVDPISSQKFRSHSIVLASHSELFNNHFQKYNDILLNGKKNYQIKLPIPIDVKIQSFSVDILEKVLSYFYISNNFDFLLRAGISMNNCFWFYSYFHSLNHIVALHQTEQFIIKQCVNPMNAIVYLLESIRFKSCFIRQKCIETIVANFEDLIKVKDNYINIRELPYDVFLMILSSNELRISKEDFVLQIIIDYINSREKEIDLPQKSNVSEIEKKNEIEPLKTDQNPSNENKDSKIENQPKNTDFKIEEKKNDPNNKTPEQENKTGENIIISEKKVEGPNNKDKTKPNENEKANLKSEKEPHKLDPLSIQKKEIKLEEDLHLLGENTDLNEKNKDLFIKYKLPFNEKLELLMACRLSHVEHETLLKASRIISIAEFRNIFIEAISAKLQNYENASKNYIINLNVRDSYKELKGMMKEENDNQISIPQISQNFNQESETSTNFDVKHYKSNLNVRNDFSAKNQNKSDLSPKASKNVERYLRSYVQQNIDKNTKENEKQLNLIYDYSDNDKSNSNKGSLSPLNLNSNGSKNHKKFSNSPIYNSFYERKDEKLQQWNHISKSQVFNNPKFMKKQQFHDQEVQSMRLPEENEQIYKGNIISPSYRYNENAKIKKAQSISPLEFIYKYDFDDNGIFYYLGSWGKTKKWINPYILKLVDVKFSSIGVGASIQDFIGRECVNCCTKNEKNAFMQFDLGEGKSLFPSCYTIRNRPSRKYVLMNWILEASINNKEWFILDKRIYLTEDSNFNSLMENEREELVEKGQTSTWGIDSENVEFVLNDLNRKSKSEIKGFRHFRLTQLMKNSDGEYNLCLSGMELYGTGFGSQWYF